MLGNLNMADMFGKIQEMQEQYRQFQEKLKDMVVEGEAGGGMVRVTANCARQVIKITIDPSILDDREMVEDLVTAAVNKAMEKAEERAKTEAASLTSGLLPGGLDLSKLGL